MNVRRSRGTINPVNLLPSKSNLKKKNLEEISDTPVKVGTFEIDLLLLCNQPEAIADFMAMHSTSPAAKEQLTLLYFKELNSQQENSQYFDDIDMAENFDMFNLEKVDFNKMLSDFILNDNPMIEGFEVNTKKNREVIDAYLNVLGDELIIEVENV